MSAGLVLLTIVAFGCLLAAFPIVLLVRGLKQGVWNGRGVNVFRSENPLAFWFGIVMYGLGAVMLDPRSRLAADVRVTANIGNIRAQIVRGTAEDECR